MRILPVAALGLALLPRPLHAQDAAALARAVKARVTPDELMAPTLGLEAAS